MKKHNNLFLLCENCSSPIILNEDLEKIVLPKVDAIQCKFCSYVHTDIQELKDYSLQSRNRICAEEK